MIIFFAGRVVSAELIDVGLIENNPEHVFTDAVCVSKGVFHGVARRATPLDDANVTIHEPCCCAGIHDRHEWRQVDQDVIARQLKIIKKLAGRISRQNVTETPAVIVDRVGQER
jgi:hypothetical protein